MMKWHYRFMDMAHLVASWSKDTTKVGAVICDSKNRVISVGYNGFPQGVEDDPIVDRETKLRRTIHAEKNAILFSRRDLTGSTLYCTHHPCGPCAAMIIQSGVSRVVIPDGQSSFARRWASDIIESELMFSQAGVEVKEIKMKLKLRTWLLLMGTVNVGLVYLIWRMI